MLHPTKGRAGMANGPNGEELLGRYFEPVYSYVAYRVAPDREVARDITQEVFLAACKSAGSLQNGDSALAWLRAIARSKVADHFRSSAARGDEVLASDELLAGLSVSDQTAASQEQQLRATRVSIVMRSLPGDYAEVLEEKYLDGLSVRSIAQREGRSEKAVESALVRAREAFRAAWKRAHADADALAGSQRSPIHEGQ